MAQSTSKLAQPTTLCKNSRAMKRTSTTVRLMACLILLTGCATAEKNRHPEKAESASRETTVKLPAPYSSVTLGAEGRYLIFYLKTSRQIAILDVTKTALVHTIAGVTEDVLPTAGRDELMLVFPGQKLIQRWSLKSFKREKVAPLPGKGTTHTALMGNSSQGPLLVAAEDAHLVDTHTMKPIALKGRIPGGASRHTPAMCISSDGGTVTSIPRGVGPVAYEHMTLNGDATTVKSFAATSHAIRWAQPNADGKLIFMPGGGVYSGNLEQQPAKWLEGSTIFPTVDPGYFISMRFGKDGENAEAVHMAICTAADRRAVHTVVGFKEMALHGNTNARRSIAEHLSYGEHRFHYIPWAGVLVSLHYDNQHVTLRRFNLMQALKNSGQDYLFVDSVPPIDVTRRDTLKYQVKVQSKHRVSKLTLESGPQGMKISRRGLVTWNVTPGFSGNMAQGIVGIADKKGNNILHSFRLKILDGIRQDPREKTDKNRTDGE